MTFDDAVDADTFRREKWPFYWLTRAVGRYIEKLEPRLKRVGLDVPRWRVLMCLGEDETMSVSSIAEEAIVKLPTMMRILKRMESEALVTLGARASDGRVTDVALTRTGLRAREAALVIALRIHDHVFIDMPEADRFQTTSHLRTIFQALED